MNKYTGIEVADSYAERVYIVSRKRSGGAVKRTLAAGIITALCFGIKYIPSPIARDVTEKLKEAVCYDVLGRETGETVVDKLLEKDEGTSA